LYVLLEIMRCIQERLTWNDSQETALALFGLVNFIVEEMITRPRKIDEIYTKLPEKDHENIELRDFGKTRQKDAATTPHSAV